MLVATWVHDYAPAIRGLVLASPAFKVKLFMVPLARPALALWHRLRGLFFINSHVTLLLDLMIGNGGEFQ